MLKKKKFKKPLTSRQKLIRENDKIISLIVRKRDNYKCCKCGKPANAVHHIFSRRYFSIRWDPMNLITLCFPHHFYYAHSRPTEFHHWVKKEMGEKAYNLLEIKSRSKKPDYGLINMALRECVKRNNFNIYGKYYKEPIFVNKGAKDDYKRNNNELFKGKRV